MGKYDFDFDLYEESTLAWIGNIITPLSSVLEFGAANGRLTKFLSEEKQCNVDIVEIDNISGSKAEKYARHAWLGLEDGDIEKYHWVDNGTQYDYIVFADVLEHLLHPEEALKRCGGVLKSTGRILISLPNISHNSIIIELLNDRFNYTPIGLLDNTHFKFFTRQSFLRMAEQTGWAVVGEKAKYVRVGENEIKNSYQEVPKEIFKYLVNRDSGNVYQYLFTLAHSSEYLMGNCERTVLLDAESHYLLRAQYELDGTYSYKKESNIHVNPYNGFIEVILSIPDNTSSALINLLNCCCIIQDLEIQVMVREELLKIASFEHNASKILNAYYFKDIPQVKIEIPSNAKKLFLKMNVVKYDFEDSFLDLLVKENSRKEQLISQICNDYEKEIQKKDSDFKESVQIYEKEIQQKDYEFKKSVEAYEQTIKNKDDEFQQSVSTYENVIKQKDIEFQRSINVYEGVVKQKDDELKKSAEAYENVIRQKDEEFKKSVDTYENVIRQKDEEFQRSVNTYENVIRQKDEEFQQSVKTYEEVIKAKDAEYLNLLKKNEYKDLHGSQ